MKFIISEYHHLEVDLEMFAFEGMRTAIIMGLEVYTIEEVILTTTGNRRDILTINISKDITNDWAISNDYQVFTSKEAKAIFGEDLIAMMYSTSVDRNSSPHENIETLGNHLLNDLSQSEQSAIKLFMFFTDVVFQPNNRITKYYGLWKRDDFKHSKFKIINQSKDMVYKTENGCIYYGACEIEFEDLEKALEYSFNNGGCFLFISPNENSEDFSFLEEGFESLIGGKIDTTFVKPDILRLFSRFLRNKECLIFLSKNGEQLSLIGKKDGIAGIK